MATRMTVVLPDHVVETVDRFAGEERRARARMVALLIEEAVNARLNVLNQVDPRIGEPVDKAIASHLDARGRTPMGKPWGPTPK